MKFNRESSESFFDFDSVTAPSRIPRGLDKTEKLLRRAYDAGRNEDLIIRRFKTGGGCELMLVCMNGMADDGKINEFILKPLMAFAGSERRLSKLCASAVEIAELRWESDLNKVIEAVSGGMTALFSEGERTCLILETRGFEKRPVGSSENENVVLGPKESFTESFRTNMTLIRRIIRSRRLTAVRLMPDSKDPPFIAMVYIEGLADPALIDRVRERVERISVSTLITSGVVEQLIEDRDILPIPRILSTERPDRAAAHIKRGRVCLVIDGSPFALIMPITLFDLLESPEDVYLRPPLGTLLRLVRFVGAFISVVMPGYFLALALYHQGMLSTEVLSTVVASRRMVFEPIALEMILLLVIFQLIREAGLRIPGSIGQAIGIIGGLIMGQAAVTAHLASSVVLIIVAASGLGNFCVPDYSTQLAASYVRLAVVFAAWMGGLLAMTSALLLLIFLLADSSSFGMPYLSPFSPKARSDRPFILRGRIGQPRTDDRSRGR